MRISLRLAWVSLAMFSSGAWAQGVQNMDISFMAGPARVKAQTIPGSSVTLAGSTGYSLAVGYGYQVLRLSAASLWVEFLPSFFVSPGNSSASIGGSADLRMHAFTPGVRFMVPVHARVSFYGAVSGGWGGFHYATIAGGNSPYVKTNSTTHGVFGFGGGVDVRVVRVISIRGEIRDFVTGRGLSGSPGQHHVVPLAGVALHF